METGNIIKQAAMIIRQELKVSFRLFLFGSRAGQKSHEKSDIDLGILADEPITPKQMINIHEKLEHIPTLLKIDCVDFSTVENEFKKNALKNAREIKI